MVVHCAYEGITPLLYIGKLSHSVSDYPAAYSRWYEMLYCHEDDTEFAIENSECSELNVNQSINLATV